MKKRIKRRTARFYEDRVFKALTVRVIKGEDVQVSRFLMVRVFQDKVVQGIGC